MTREQIKITIEGIKADLSLESYLKPWQTEALDELMDEFDRLKSIEEQHNALLVSEDICGLCGQPGANKIPHPLRWPGERAPGTELVHDECEAEECRQAHLALTQEQKENFLRSL